MGWGMWVMVSSSHVSANPSSYREGDLTLFHCSSVGSLPMEDSCPQTSPAQILPIGYRSPVCILGDFLWVPFNFHGSFSYLWPYQVESCTFLQPKTINKTICLFECLIFGRSCKNHWFVLLPVLLPESYTDHTLWRHLWRNKDLVSCTKFCSLSIIFSISLIPSFAL